MWLHCDVPMSLELAMRFVATNLMVLWEAPEDRMVAAKQALDMYVHACNMHVN